MNDPQIPDLAQQWNAIKNLLPFSLGAGAFAAFRARHSRWWVMLANGFLGAAAMPIATLAFLQMYPNKFWVALAVGGFIGSTVSDMVRMGLQAVAKRLGVKEPKQRKGDL
jgi:hypothetical protein